jgi:hypothetical protein
MFQEILDRQRFHRAAMTIQRYVNAWTLYKSGNRAAETIQSACRGWFQRAAVKQCQSAAVIMQKFWRWISTQSRFRWQRLAAIKLQAIQRGRRGRFLHGRSLDAALCLQRAVRVNKRRRNLEMLRQSKEFRARHDYWLPTHSSECHRDLKEFIYKYIT